MEAAEYKLIGKKKRNAEICNPTIEEEMNFRGKDIIREENRNDIVTARILGGDKILIAEKKLVDIAIIHNIPENLPEKSWSCMIAWENNVIILKNTRILAIGDTN